MSRAVLESSCLESQAGKPVGLPVDSHAQGENLCGSFSD